MRVSLLRRDVSPCVGPVGALGELRWFHLYRPGWSPPFCRVPLELRSVFYVLLCAIPPVFMAIIWSVSLTPACPLLVTLIRGRSLDICVACDWLDFLSSSSLFRDSVICADLWSRQQGPDDYCVRHSVALALSLDYGGSDPLLLRYAWWSSRCLEAGLTSRPLLALPGLCLMPDL